MTPSPTLEFNPLTPEFIANPHPFCQKLRERTAMFYWEAARSWVATRHAECTSLMRDRRFSLDYTQWEHAPPAVPADRQTEYDRVMQHGLFRGTEQGHARMRRLAGPAFSVRAAERLRPAIQAFVDEAVEQAARDGVMDGCRFAEYIPQRVIRQLLAIPGELEQPFRRFTESVIVATNPAAAAESFAKAVADFAEGAAMLRGLLQDRRRNPLAGDTLSELLAAQEEGDQLSFDEILALAVALIVAGTETTVHLISYGLLNLLRHPEALAQIRQDPSLLRGALDEVLRYDYITSLGVPRYAREDLELGGVTVRARQMVIPLMVGALRDPAAFPEPDRFDIRRDASPSLAFGSGPHYCIGAPLGRLEGQLAVETMLRRFPNLRLTGEPAYGFSPMMRPMKSLPLAL